MRSISLPRISTSSTIKPEHRDDTDMAFTPPSSSQYQFAPGHSRESSGASAGSSSPVTSTFSTSGHNRWPSSTSSLVTTPDSPANVAKAPLHDLVEVQEPGEVEEQADDVVSGDLGDDPLCICDSAFCEHRQFPVLPSSPRPSVYTEWTPGDDRTYSFAPSIPTSVKRSRSGEISGSKLGSRRRRRFQSISSVFRDMRPITSVSSHTVQSAPTTPASHSRRPSITEYLARQLEPRRTSVRQKPQGDIASNYSYAPSIMESSEELDVPNSATADDPIDREGLSSTPLLPPLLSTRYDPSEESMQSPLQSPSVANYSETASLANFSIHGPTNLPTPPLSAKPSFTSFNRPAPPPPHHQPLSPESEPEPDYWALTLGHANFSIHPEPYTPDLPTHTSCRQLLADWESARIAYLRVAARVAEHYGPSSPVYALTEAKWAGIDREWRANLERANAGAKARGEAPVQQWLAETEAGAGRRMPELVDPQRPKKFLDVDEADIVGPMVRYVRMPAAKATEEAAGARRTGLLGLFKEPGSLFGGRGIFGGKR